MADTYFAKLTDAVDVPPTFEGVTLPLDQLLADVAYHGSTIDVTDPTVPPGTDPEPDPISEDDYLVGLDEFDNPADDGDPLVPETPEEEDEGEELVAARTVVFDLEALSDIEVRLPVVDAVRLVVNPAPFQAKVTFDVDLVSVEATVGLAVRFDRNVLVPMVANSAGGFDVDTGGPDVEITVASASILATSAGTVAVDGGLGLRLNRPAMIGNTGVIIESADITFNFDGTGDRPDGAPAGWAGVLIKNASIRIPSVFSGSINATKLGFGSGGVTGGVSVTLPGDPTDKVLGMTGGLTTVGLTFQENIPTQATIGARVQIPFFDFPTPVELDISIGIDGTVTATLSGGKTLISLDKPGLAKFDLKSLTVGVEHGEFFTSLSGALTPEVVAGGGLTWPTFDLKELRIDASGHVTIAGGWIDLPSQKSFSLYGFTVEITKIGFGTQDDGHRWIGFSGGISLVSGIKAGASVKGLRIIFPPDFSSLPSLSLEGVGIDFEIPNAIAVTGSVSLTGQDFKGAVKVVVEPISLTIDGQFVTGTVPGTNERYFGILLHGELPTGIPLGATGLAIYGFAGLYGQDLAPDKHANEDWFENPDGSKGWYQRDPVGVDDLLNKWKPTSGAFAFGAGVTIGTYADNGYEFSGRLLLVLSFPGPTILIDGRANLFKKRSELSGNDPIFRALAVIQPGQSFLLGLAAHYKYKDDGKLLDIKGSAEAFFDFNHADNWHIFIGRKDPKLKARIAATIFKLFDVNGYFELTPASLAVGAGWSFDKRYGFGSLGVHVQASFQTDATVSWHPNHFTGDVILDGSARLEAFGHGVGVKAHADVTGDVFEPFHLHGNFSVGIDLPWPLPDLGGTISFDWQETLTSTPALPLPLREATVEHTKRMLKWPIPRDAGALLPNNDTGGDLELPGSAAIGAAPPDTASVPGSAPKVPADAAIGLTFSRPVKDGAGVSVNPTGVDAETIGDLSSPQKPVGPYTVQYQLSSLSLEKLVPAPEKITDPNALGPRFVKVAEAHGAFDQPGVPQLFAAWGPAPTDASTPAANSQQLKLLVNAKTPFDYGAQQLQLWDTWFETANSSYPCQPPAATDPNQQFCATFVNEQFPSEGNEIDFSNPDFSVIPQDAAEFVDSVEQVPNGNGSHRSFGVVGTLAPDDEVLVIPPVGIDEVDINVGRVDIFSASAPGLPKLVATVPTRNQIQNNIVVMPAAVLAVYALTDPHDPNADLTPGPGPGKVLQAPAFNPDGSLQTGTLMEITLQPPATAAVSIELDALFSFDVDSAGGPDVSEVITFDEAGARTVLTITNLVRQFVPLHGSTRIVRVAIRSAGTRFANLYGVHVRTPVSAVAVSREGSDVFGPYEEVNGLIKVLGEDIGIIKLGTPTPCEFTILELCTPNRTVSLTRHTMSSLDLLADEDFVFDPQADYRMVVTTRRGDHTTKHQNQNRDDASIVNFDIKLVEQAYFHVVAPPGIENPDRPVTTPASPAGPTGFEDLAFYVASTIPDSTPASDGKPVIPRAFYRSYDPSIAFNEPSKVEKMYRLARRDLTLRLFDAANNPVVDANGRAVIPTTRWDAATQATLTDAQQKWITMVNAAACRPTDIPPFDPKDALTNQIASGPAEIALLAETLYQAHLVPALLHEPFVNPIAGLAADGTHRLERWIAVNSDAAAPGRWIVDSADVIGPDGQPVIGPDGKHVQTFFATETSGHNSTLLYDGPIGAATSPDQPALWSDFRASFQFRFPTGSVAILLRHVSSTSLISIAFSRDPNTGTGTRLVTSVDQNGQTFLNGPGGDQPDLGSPDTDVVVSVDCIGNQLRVSQAGVPDLKVTLPDTAPAAGPVGFFASAASGCRFTEIRVDDLRVPPPPPAPPALPPPTPSTALRFDFITSKYVNFAHHLASFDDQAFDVPSALGVTGDQLTAKLPVAVQILAGGPAGFGLAPPSDDEKRAFDDLELAAIGADERLRAPDGLEILNASHEPAVTAVLIRSPEPFQWERTHLATSVALSTPKLGTPGDVKMVAVSFGPTPPEESVTMLVRAGRSLAGFSIQWRHVADTTNADPPWTTYFTFATEPVVGEGTAIPVFSGSSADAPAREPGTQQRFVASDAASAVAVFPTDGTGVELRLLDATGTVVHQREFKPTGNLSQQIGVNVIRKGDGTALFLFSTPLTGATRPPGLRLDFLFTRNPGTNVTPPPFPILRQAGSDTTEVAALELALPAS